MCTSQTTEDFFLFEMTVENVKANKSNLQQAVVLKVRTVNKYLPILIGSVEANEISLKVLGQKTAPTYDTRLDRLDDTRLERKIARVVVSEMQGKMLLAKVLWPASAWTCKWYRRG